MNKNLVKHKSKRLKTKSLSIDLRNEIQDRYLIYKNLGYV